MKLLPGLGLDPDPRSRTAPGNQRRNRRPQGLAEPPTCSTRRPIRMNRIAQAPPSTTPDSRQADEALRRVTLGHIGPRKPGVIYYAGDRMVQVRRVITDLDEARRVLRR